MRTSTRRAAVLLTLAGIGLGLSAVPASAATVPFSNPSKAGYLGFCDKAGNPITSGSLMQKPAIWTSVSSTAAPDGFSTTKNAKATLYAFQPRRDVDPGEWSGSQLTAGSLFSNDGHPMTAATTIDSPLSDFTSSFPAKWDGLVELRMYFTAPNHVPYNQTYPTTVIKVTGGRWAVVSGGATLACNLGKAVSSETLYLAPSTFNKPQPAGTSQAAAGTTAGRSSTAAPSSPAAGRTATPSKSGSATARPTSARPTAAATTTPVTSNAAGPKAASGSHAGPAWIAAVVALLAVAAGLVWRRRRAG